MSVANNLAEVLDRVPLYAHHHKQPAGVASFRVAA